MSILGAEYAKNQAAIHNLTKMNKENNNKNSAYMHQLYVQIDSLQQQLLQAYNTINSLSPPTAHQQHLQIPPPPQQLFQPPQQQTYQGTCQTPYQAPYHQIGRNGEEINHNNNNNGNGQTFTNTNQGGYSGGGGGGGKGTINNFNGGCFPNPTNPVNIFDNMNNFHTHGSETKNIYHSSTCNKMPA